MALTKALMKVLVCPRCKGKLKVVPEGEGLDCLVCKLRYPIRDDIPVMLVEEATRLK